MARRLPLVEHAQGNRTVMEFFGKTAVVTAAANGIGRAVALLLASGGATVIAVDREEPGLTETARLAAAVGGRVEQACLDCRDESAVEAFFESIEAVHILVNAIGSSARERASDFVTSKSEVWDFVHGVTLTTAMLCTRYAIPKMLPLGSGRIINITSDAALRPTARMAEYAAAKAGVIGFTRAMAVELGPRGITVNAVAPALIQTRALDSMPASLLDAIIAEIPVGRIGTVDEVAHAVAFLAGEHSAFITGQTLAMNGGRNFV